MLADLIGWRFLAGSLIAFAPQLALIGWLLWQGRREA